MGAYRGKYLWAETCDRVVKADQAPEFLLDDEALAGADSALNVAWDYFLVYFESVVFIVCES